MAARVAARAPVTAMPGSWAPMGTGIPDINATAAAAARAVAAVAQSSVSTHASEEQRPEPQIDESVPQEFTVAMPNMVRHWPPLHLYPPSLRNALSFLTSIDLPTDVDDAAPILADLPEDARPSLTLVLDLDETLVHCKLEYAEAIRHDFCVSFEETTAVGYVYVRPYAKLFLEIVSRLFEVVVFTASSHAYADQVLDRLDPEGKYFSARLYRQHCTPEANGAYLKDIRRLGRPLSRVVLVDNSPVSLALCPDNGIIVQGWVADRPEDRELLDLLLLLQRGVQTADMQEFLAKRYSLHEFFEELRRYPDLIGPI